MDKKANRALAAAVGALAALLLADAWLSYRNTRDLTDRAAWVSHTLEVQEALAGVRAAVTDAEAGIRAYLVTGDDSSLPPYRAAAEAASGRIDWVEELTADNPAQQARVPRLRQRARERLGQLARLQAVRREQGFDAARKEMVAGEGGPGAMPSSTPLGRWSRRRRGCCGSGRTAPAGPTAPPSSPACWRPCSGWRRPAWSSGWAGGCCWPARGRRHGCTPSGKGCGAA